MIAAFLESLRKRMRVDHEVVLIVADSGPPEIDLFAEEFPGRFLDVGIAESNAVLIATGLALEGFKPVVVALARYLTGRAYDQIRQAFGVMELPIMLVGTGSGVSLGPMGASHYCLDDLALMRTMPAVSIHIASSDAIAAQLVEFLEDPAPRYLRLEARVERTPRQMAADLRSQPAEVAVISAGTITDEVHVAREILRAEYDLDIDVLDVRDLGCVGKMLDQRPGFIITVEEHGPGGLATIVRSALRTEPVRFGALHMSGAPLRSETVEVQRIRNGLDARSLAKFVHDFTKTEGPNESRPVRAFQL